MSRSTHFTGSTPSAFGARSFRLLGATVLLALSAAVAQTANAQPMPGGPGGGPGMSMGMGMGMGAPRQMGHMLDLVKATPEQRTQIQALVAAARADMKAQHEAGRALHEQGRALFAQPTVDARAAEALRQQMMAQHDTASKRTLQLMLDVSRVLTPEQRKTLSDTMAQRRSMMERHRAERQAAPGAKPQQ
jgi:Spy/CpxP family protein refolding chaperone